MYKSIYGALSPAEIEAAQTAYEAIVAAERELTTDERSVVGLRILRMVSNGCVDLVAIANACRLKPGFRMRLH